MEQKDGFSAACYYAVYRHAAKIDLPALEPVEHENPAISSRNQSNINLSRSTRCPVGLMSGHDSKCLGTETALPYCSVATPRMAQNYFFFFFSFSGSLTASKVANSML